MHSQISASWLLKRPSSTCYFWSLGRESHVRMNLVVADLEKVELHPFLLHSSKKSLYLLIYFGYPFYRNQAVWDLVFWKWTQPIILCNQNWSYHWGNRIKWWNINFWFRLGLDKIRSWLVFWLLHRGECLYSFNIFDVLQVKNWKWLRGLFWSFLIN